ncbi:TPA_asm: hypothetical protein Cy-LDV1_g39 [Cyanophage Cy-LDV1]|nr:TPA_asm: hypothetical protein Cy-LDV1_g39 [Cyanophage Cy-LDV1]
MTYEERRREGVSLFMENERKRDRIARWAIGLQLFSVACWIAVLVLEFWT